MNAPVDKNAAAGDFLGGKGTAEPRNGAVSTEADIDVINFAELAGLDKLAQLVYAGIEAIDNADIEYLAGFVLSFLHELCFGISSCGRLFAKHVFACFKSIDGYLGVHSVGSADRNCFDLGIVQSDVVIFDSGAAVVLFDTLFGLFPDDIAEILYLDIGVRHIGGNMRIVCDTAAADDRNLHFGHDASSGK